MKATLFALFVALLMVGCGESPKPSESVDVTDTAPKKDAIESAVESAVDASKLQHRNGVTYLPNTEKPFSAQEPFSGYAKVDYDNGQSRVLAQYENGSVIWMKRWYKNGENRSVMNIKNESANGLSTVWYENGQKMAEENYKDGKMHGVWTQWYESGKKWQEKYCKDGKVISLVAWKPNGEKCPVSNVKKGYGVLVLYKEDGTEDFRLAYKDGEAGNPY